MLQWCDERIFIVYSGDIKSKISIGHERYRHRLFNVIVSFIRWALFSAAGGGTIYSLQKFLSVHMACISLTVSNDVVISCKTITAFHCTRGSCFLLHCYILFLWRHIYSRITLITSLCWHTETSIVASSSSLKFWCN